MAEFQELIKNFDRIRDYMRQFYAVSYTHLALVSWARRCV